MEEFPPDSSTPLGRNNKITMATEKKAEKSDREMRWEALLESYKLRNPLKYEAKMARGEFSKIPDSFA